MLNIETVDKRNVDSVSKLQTSSLNGGTTTYELALEKERGNLPTRSKYLKRQNESESEKQQASASVSSTKPISVGNKRMSILPNNPSLGKKEFGSKSVESGSKFAGISRPLPNVISKDNTRECLNAENIKPRNDSGPNKEEPAPRGMNENTLHVNAVRSDVHPSTQTEQSIKDLSQNSLNTGVQATSMKSTLVCGDRSSEYRGLRFNKSMKIFRDSTMYKF